MTLQEKQYVARLEKEHGEWKKRALGGVGLLSDVLCAQLFNIGQKMAALNAQAMAETREDVQLALMGGVIALETLAVEICGKEATPAEQKEK